MLADDGVLFREGLARILGEAGFEVAGQADNPASLIAMVRRDPPDVVVVDLRMPPDFGAEGLEAAIEIRGAVPEVGILLLSQYVEAHHALRLMTEFDGRVGYLLKDRVSDLSVFAADLRRLARGDVVVDPELVNRLLARRRQHDPIETLSERERAVLELMAQGLSNAALAAELHLSLKTIESHVGAIFTKLDLAPGERENRRVLAVLRFLRQG